MTLERPAPNLGTVFLDRDGTINRKAPEGEYVTSWQEFEFLPGAVEAIRELTGRGKRVIVVTNQRGIARRRMSSRALAAIHRRMLDELTAAGGCVTGVYHCPHDEGSCECRKPQTGMFLQAQRDHPEIDFSTSAVIGDSICDVEAAVALGSHPTLVSPTCPVSAPASLHREPSLRDAVRWLLGAPMSV